MAPARRRAPARNGTSAKSPEVAPIATPESTTEVDLPRRAAAPRKQQQAGSRSRGKKAADPESEPEEQDEEDDNEASAQGAEDDQDNDQPPAGRAAAAAQAEGPLVRLHFNEPLSWRPGKPIPTEELIRRLETLSRELSDLDQETFDTESLAKVAKELASHNLLNHKDKGVKAFAASCLVDILCLCAPNAPFTQTQLKVGSSHA